MSIGFITRPTASTQASRHQDMENTYVINPFIVGKYYSPHYFCDRCDETAFLIKQIDNGRNVALISPRRMGKTGLINHCFIQPQVAERYHTIFVDIYATTSLSELVYLLGKAIYEELKPKGRVWAERFFQVISSLRMGFTIDPMTGEPGFDLSLGDIKSPHTTLDEIFRYLETADKPCVVAIDEFQQIGCYEEKNVEALLRTKMQQCRHTRFVFAGSKRHLMSNMFCSSSKPFYQSAVCMGLDPIPADTYVAFATQLFEERGKHVDGGLVRKVYDSYGGCTWFVQMMMNELFALTPTGGTCREDVLPQAEAGVVMMQEVAYKDIMAHLAPKQKLVLQAIAKEGVAHGITSSAFMSRHSLPSASSVQSAVKGLLKNDIITQDADSYRVYDYFFALWLRKEF